ncbi:MAG: hypothetical protein Q7T38_07070 [Gallionella sp.]|nr:hypothetical protein [Gallionella sp.]
MGELSVIELPCPPDDFLPDEPEGAAFHNAFLASGISGFKCRYLAISRGDTRIAVVPYFLSTFSLGSLLPDGLLKKSLAWIKFRYACVGHPSTDFGAIDGEVSAEVLDLVNSTLAKQARLIAYKGFADNLPLPGFVRARGLPVAVLNIRGDYYSELDARRRNDFRHKLEKAQPLRFEECTDLPEQLVPQVYELYMNTYNHAPVKFERLTLAYFQQTAAISRFLLFFEGSTLIGFAQIIGKNQKALFKYVGMNYLHGHTYGLYYAMCLKGIEACLKEDYRQLELGVTSYHFKHLLGSQLVETCLYYRHNNALFNYLLGKLRFLIEPTADELR